jgi:hypothetical protein
MKASKERLSLFKKITIRAAKSFFPNAYLYRGPFFPRARGTCVEALGIAVEGFYS